MDTPIQPTCGVPTASLDGAIWHRSSYSGTQGNCVEFARNLLGLVAVRDSKDRDGAIITVTGQGWERFIHTLKRGKYVAG
jgi:Domain of unknown function (DUF397)